MEWRCFVTYLWNDPRTLMNLPQVINGMQRLMLQRHVLITELIVAYVALFHIILYFIAKHFSSASRIIFDMTIASTMYSLH